MVVDGVEKGVILTDSVVPIKNDDGIYADVQFNDLTKEIPEIKLNNWVTSSEDVDLKTSPIPSNGTQSGTTIPNIINKVPKTEDIYADWTIERWVDKENPSNNLTVVPQWRLSLFKGEQSTWRTAIMALSLRPDVGHGGTSFSPTGLYRYDTVNPNGKRTSFGDVKKESWLHSKALTKGTYYISHGSVVKNVDVNANLTLIKSTDLAGLSAASWITDSGSKAGLLSYDVKTNTVPTGYSGPNQITKDMVLSVGLYNLDTYDHWYSYYRHRKGDCYCGQRHENPPATFINATYSTRNIFDRYNQQNTDSKKLVVQPEIKQDNGFTTIRFQQPTTLNIYPEYGMLFANDAGKESIKWIVGDQARKVSPVVYQTLEHKVYVTPISSGTPATDSRAVTAANKVGESNKQVLYKGGAVNTNFNVMKSATENQKGLLTVKTFALDFEDSVKAGWGNGGYSSQAAHDTLVSNINSKATATATEKLLVDSPNYNNIDYTGAVKSLQTDKYKIKTYSGKTVTTFTHELIVRGGVVVGVRLQDRNTKGYSLVSIANLKTRDEALYNAILGMNLYNESIDRSKTVFSTFEHATGDVLQEPDYATKLASARSSVDGLATPSYSGVSGSTGWYSEDSTVLVIKEYVTNYDVPSISFSDKLSMSVKGLESPVNKNDFFSKLGKGYTYLKYDLPIKSGAGDTSAYFEFTSFPGDSLDFGQQKVDYLVPNASVSDTTRLN